MALDLRCLTVLLMMPEAVELSICMGFGPCGCPISSSEVLSNYPSLALMNRPPNSASDYEAITFLEWPLPPIFLHYVWFVMFGENFHLGRNDSPPCCLLWIPADMMHHFVYAIAFGLRNI